MAFLMSKKIGVIFWTIVLGYPMLIAMGVVEVVCIGKAHLIPLGIWSGIKSVTIALYEEIFK